MDHESNRAKLVCHGAGRLAAVHGNADRRDKKSVRKIGSRNVLLNQIKGKACERSLAEGKSHNFPTVLPERLAEPPKRP